MALLVQFHKTSQGESSMSSPPAAQRSQEDGESDQNTKGRKRKRGNTESQGRTGPSTSSSPPKKGGSQTPQHQAPFHRGRGGHFRPSGRGRGRGGGDQGYQTQQTPYPNKARFKSCHHYNRGRCERRLCTWPHICSGCGKTHPLSA